MHGDDVRGVRGVARRQHDSQEKTPQCGTKTSARRSSSQARGCASTISAGENSTHRMQIYHGIRNLIVGRPCHKQVMPQTIRAGSPSRQELIIGGALPLKFPLATRKAVKLAILITEWALISRRNCGIGPGHGVAVICAD
jgi:hypothetical protein